MADIALVESWGWNGRPYIPYAKRKKARIQNRSLQQVLDSLGARHVVKELEATQPDAFKVRN